MLDKERLKETVRQLIDGTEIFVTDLNVSPDNRVVVEIDSPDGIDIDICEKITRGILDKFDRDVEDYELEVGSAGLTSPFKVPEQYVKNLGEELEVLTKDGRKIYGRLVEFDNDNSAFTIEVTKKIKEPGKKRPQIVTQPETISISDTKYVKVHFK